MDADQWYHNRSILFYGSDINPIGGWGIPLAPYIDTSAPGLLAIEEWNNWTKFLVSIIASNGLPASTAALQALAIVETRARIDNIFYSYSDYQSPFPSAAQVQAQYNTIARFDIALVHPVLNQAIWNSDNNQQCLTQVLVQHHNYQCQFCTAA